MQLSFGSGVLIGNRTDITPSVPMNFGLVQTVTIDISFDLKELYGQYQFPIAVARGKGKITGKATTAMLSGLALGHLFFGIAPTVGQQATSLGEVAVIPSSGYTVTAANAANFLGDLGVIYAATGLPLKRVTTPSAAGQYSVNVATGTYTFFSADANQQVLTSYTYNVAATGQRIAMANQLMGAQPTFQANFFSTLQGKPISLQLNNCVTSKIGFGTKLDDFTIPEFDFSAYADASNNIGTWSTAEQS